MINAQFKVARESLFKDFLNSLYSTGVREEVNSFPTGRGVLDVFVQLARSGAPGRDKAAAATRAELCTTAAIVEQV